MVEPIRSNVFFSSPPPPPSSTHSPSAYEDAIVSLTEALAPWVRTPPPPPPQLTLPSSLPPDDPFGKMVFSLTPAGALTFRSPRKYELASNIFQTLGAGGPLYWLRHRQQLETWEKELVSMPGDPFEFLFFLTHNQTMARSILSFKKIAESSSKMGLCYLIGRHPWKIFLGKQTESFALRGRPEMIPGFCLSLSLDQPLVTSLFEAKKWEDLIHYVLKARKKHLSISSL